MGDPPEVQLYAITVHGCALSDVNGVSEVSLERCLDECQAEWLYVEQFILQNVFCLIHSSHVSHVVEQ